MVILSLHLTHFGKFENRTVMLRPGMNIITGKNASGKTTIAEFIPAMLYGLKTGSESWKRFLPDKKRDVSYGGTMQLIFDDVFYEIERSFKEHEESLTVWKLPEREVIENPEAFLQVLLNGVSEEHFLNHFMISSQYLKKAALIWTEEGRTEEELQRIRVRKHYKRAENFLAEKEKVLSKELDPSVKEKLTSVETEIADGSDKVDLLQDSLRVNEGTIHSEEEEKTLLQKEIEKAVKEKAEVEKQLEAVSLQAEKTKKDRTRRPVLSIILFILSMLSVAGSFFVAYYRITTIYKFVIPHFSSILIIAALLLFFLGILFLIIALARRNRAIRLQNKEESLRKETEGLEKIMEKSKRLQEVEVHMALVTKETEELRDELTETIHILSIKEKEYKELSGKMDRIKEVENEISAVVLAKNSFSELSKTEIDPELLSISEIANDYYNKMSDTGEYKLAISEDRLLYLLKGEETVKLSELSDRGKEEALFSVQLALLEKEEAEGMVPFILDDAFSGYDSDRMNAALQMLREMNRQVVLLTCHKRERQAL